jgi:hypothetical protein
MTTYATLKMSDGREIRLPEQFAIKVRKSDWTLDVAKFATVSIVRTWLYGGQRIINDAAGAGSPATQQANAKKRLAELIAGAAPTRAPREDKLLSEAIKIAIAREVRPFFKSEGRKQIWADMVQVAKKVVADDKRYFVAAQATLDAAAKQKAANESFFTTRPDVDADTAQAMQLLEFSSDENSDEDIIDSAEAAE